jgi:hypothetical protein
MLIVLLELIHAASHEHSAGSLSDERAEPPHRKRPRSAVAHAV